MKKGKKTKAKESGGGRSPGNLSPALRLPPTSQPAPCIPLPLQVLRKYHLSVRGAWLEVVSRAQVTELEQS